MCFYKQFLYYAYLLFLEMSPVLAYFWCAFTWQPYAWAELCLSFAGCQINFLKQSHNTAFFEPNGCLFFSRRSDDAEDLYNKVIDTYITEGWALNLTPYSYLSTWLNAMQTKTDLATTLITSGYNKIIVYPDLDKEEYTSLYISFAWEKQMSIQIILTQDKVSVLDIKQK